MKKKYEIPELEEVKVYLEDIIATSGESTFDHPFGGEGEGNFGW